MGKAKNTIDENKVRMLNKFTLLKIIEQILI